MMEVTEETVIAQAKPFLQKLCHRQWCNLEPEDRYAEVQFIFWLSMRKFPTDSGHFLEDFQAVVNPYMDELNRKTPSLRYNLSLDADLRTRSGSQNWNSYSYLTTRDNRDSHLYVKFFMESLPEYERELIRDLLCGTPKKELAFAYGLDHFQLDALLEHIGNRYLAEYGEN